MKDKRNFAWFVMGLTIGIMGIFGFDYIKKYPNIIIPILITTFFGAFVYILAIHLQTRHEVLKFKYEAYKDCNFYLSELEKEIRNYTLILTPIYLNEPETSKKLESKYEKIMDSISKLSVASFTLIGLFSSQEFKEQYDKYQENISKLKKVIGDIETALEAKSKKSMMDIKTYNNKMEEIENNLNKSFKSIRKAFLNLQNAIFKELKIT